MRIIVAILFTVMAVGTVQAKDLKVGFVYNSSVGDKGYSYAHDLGRQEIAKLGGVKTSYVEGVVEGPDAERVMVKMARKGFDVVFSTSYGYMNSVHKIAPQHPKVQFFQCDSGSTVNNGVSNYFGRIYQARYLSGMVAGSMTKSDVVGYVAAFPIPEVVRGINAFTLGAQAVNPEASVRVVWTRTWYGPATEKEAAKSLFDVGADVIAQHQNSPAAQEAAEERGAYSIGYNSDMQSFAPNAHLTSVVWNWAPYYVNLVQQVQAGTWTEKAEWPGLESGIIALSPYGDMVPQDVRDKVNARQQEIAEEKYKVFQGPIKDQEGNLKVAEGSAPTDDELLGMMWFVQGVRGTTN